MLFKCTKCGRAEREGLTNSVAYIICEKCFDRRNREKASQDAKDPPQKSR